MSMSVSSGGMLIGRPPYRRHRRSHPWFGIPWLSQKSLGDDISLHLTGTAGNGQAPRRQEALLPALGLAVEDRPIRLIEGHAHLLHPLLVLHAQQLAHAGAAPRINSGKCAQR